MIFVAYEFKNGILHKDGRAIMGFGVSYYPSFYPTKYPVPPTADRTGEMKKDLRLMHESGFHFLRAAALSDISLSKDGSVEISSPFIDDMAREAEKNDLGISIRLQGYVMNIRGNKDYLMINNDGEEMCKDWASFMHSTFFHDGILKDNYDCTKALAEHYLKFKSLISYQIYNEPHYPANGVFDYHPLAVDAYRKHLVKTGVLTKDEAKNYYPPKKRPQNKEKIEEWVRWRLFSMRALSDFLIKSSDASKDGAKDIETFTCMTVSSSGNNNADRGESFFEVCEGMDSISITLYTNFDGVDYFSAKHTINLSESAAALCGKHAWAAELDARTKMPSRKFYQSTYAIIGAGHKGICYYQWRGDCPRDGVPEGDVCGLLHTDGTKTDAFDRDIKLLKYLNDFSDKIVKCEKKRTHIAVLHSDYGYAYADALTDNLMGGVNIWQYITVSICKKLYQLGFNVDFVRASDLDKNVLDVKALYVPIKYMLSDVETEKIDTFAKNGAKVFFHDITGTFEAMCADGFWDWTNPPKNRAVDDFRGGMEIDDTVEMTGLIPFVETFDKNLFADVIECEEYKIVAFVSNHPTQKTIKSHKIKLNFGGKTAKFMTPFEEKEFEITDGYVDLPDIDDGALMFVY